MLIDGTSYGIDSYSCPPDALRESVIYRTFIDGSVSAIDYGARVKRESTFRLINIEKADFVSLVNYLIENAGQKILLTAENDGEKIFGESVAGGGVSGYEYYVYVLEPTALQEEDFSNSDELYTLTLKVALAGTTSGAVPNEAGTSLIDVLVKVDTTAGASPGGTEPPTPSIGDRWIDIAGNEGGANVLYVCKDPDGAAFADRWRALYTVAADDTDIGWVGGAFYWSSFSDVSYDGITWKAGFLNYNSVQFNAMSIDISKGPALARKEGFSFSVANVESVSRTFWKFIIDNSINLFGAVCSGGVWRSGLDYTSLATGKNITNSFDYTDYQFKVEPFLLNNDTVFPDGTISDEDSRYTDVKEETIGKAPFVTYGEFDVAAMQDISTDDNDVFATRTFAAPRSGTGTVKVIVGRIRWHAFTLNCSQVEFQAGSGYTRYYVNDDNLELLQDTRVGELLITYDWVNAANNWTRETRLEVKAVNYSASPYYIEVENQQRYNGDGADEVKGSPWGHIYIYTSKLYIRKTIDSANNYDHYAFTAADLTSMAEGNHVFKVIADTRGEETPSLTGNIGKVYQIDYVDTVTNADYYILEFSPQETVGPLYSSLGETPYTDSRLTVTVFKYALQYQIDEEDCEAFGYADNAGNFASDHLEFKYLSDDGKTLLDLPNTDFIINSENNIVTLNPRTAADSSVVDTYEPIHGEHLNPMPLMIINYPIIEGSDTSFDFSDIWAEPAPFSWRCPPYGSGWVTPSFGMDWILPYMFTFYPYSGRYRVMPTESKIELRACFNPYPELLDENYSTVYAFKVPVLRTENDEDFIYSDEVRLGIYLKINSLIDSYNMDQVRTRHQAQGYFVRIRFEKYDGTFVDDDDWEHEISSGNLGVKVNSGGTYGDFEINNFPTSDNGGFGDEIDLDDKSRLIHKYIQWYGVKATIDADHTGEFRAGDILYDTSSLSFFVMQSDGSWDAGTALTSADEGYLIYYKNIYINAPENVMYKVSGGVLVEATAGTDFQILPKLTGEDLWDVSSLFGETPLWTEVKSMHILFATKAENQFIGDYSEDSEMGRYYRLDFSVEIKAGPTLFKTAQFDVVERPIFGAVQGRLIDGTFSTSAEDIFRDIIDRIQPDNYDDDSITSLFSGDRIAWNWRRQFTEAMDSHAALNELLLNAWAIGVINASDQIEFKPIDETRLYATPNIELTDANIIQDSFSKVEFRDSNEIYQKFSLGYDFNPVSEYSNAVKDYRKEAVASRDEGDLENQILLRVSGDLYNLDNKYKQDFKYHYESMPLTSWAIQWFGFNYWRFDVDVALENILGAAALTLGDTVTVNGYIHTNATVYGFVVKIKPNVYNGTVTLGVYCPSPPGKLGTFCDPFNDALNGTSRDISGWTGANGKINDAGQGSVRTLGSYTVKDAGQGSTREFCT